MALKDLVKGSIQGVLGNYTEMEGAELDTYKQYLMEGENVARSFKLVRDVLIFTDRRIIFFDKQGATGQKMHVESINLDSIVDVEMETAGFGYDDSELSFTYIKTPNRKAHSIDYRTKKLEFPKKFAVQPLYLMLQELAYENYRELNK